VFCGTIETVPNRRVAETQRKEKYLGVDQAAAEKTFWLLIDGFAGERFFEGKGRFGFVWQGTGRGQVPPGLRIRTLSGSAERSFAE
jgi:hypothetical protein